MPRSANFTPGLRVCAIACAVSAAGWAQGSAFQTPGMPAPARASPGAPANDATAGPAGASQSSRFDSSFNPAFSFVVDAVADWRNTQHTTADGVDLELRVLEFGAQAWVDPNAWAYFIGAADEESVNVEEAAVHFTGLGGNSTLRAGRFFIDFGKQMQVHVHELRTLERPLALRTYLGDEIKGDGVQWDSWTSAGESTVVRWSVGMFRSLLPEAEDADSTTTAESSVADRKDAQDLNFTARLTGFRDVGDHGVFQLGTSARMIPDYALDFAPSGDAETGLANTVFGFDATYGWSSDTGAEKWTVGGELLFDTGDVGSTITDVGGDGDPTNDTIAVLNGTRAGWFAFADYAWSPVNSAGLQFSQVELPAPGGADARELELYWSHEFSEFHRVRLAVSDYETDAGDDEQRVAVQYTAIVGAHGHGLNW
jgi:hypothetical protein